MFWFRLTTVSLFARPISFNLMNVSKSAEPGEGFLFDGGLNFFNSSVLEKGAVVLGQECPDQLPRRYFDSWKRIGWFAISCEKHPVLVSSHPVHFWIGWGRILSLFQEGSVQPPLGYGWRGWQPICFQIVCQGYSRLQLWGRWSRVRACDLPPLWVQVARDSGSSVMTSLNGLDCTRPTGLHHPMNLHWVDLLWWILLVHLLVGMFALGVLVGLLLGLRTGPIAPEEVQCTSTDTNSLDLSRCCEM